MIRVTIDIDEDDHLMNRMTVEIHGDPNVESCIEELRTRIVAWAIT